MLYFTTWGHERGCCRHRHRSLESAADCLRDDARHCAAFGANSDRSIRIVTSSEQLARYDELQLPVPPQETGQWRQYVPLAR